MAVWKSRLMFVLLCTGPGNPSGQVLLELPGGHARKLLAGALSAACMAILVEYGLTYPAGDDIMNPT